VLCATTQPPHAPRHHRCRTITTAGCVAHDGSGVGPRVCIAEGSGDVARKREGRLSAACKVSTIAHAHSGVQRPPLSAAAAASACAPVDAAVPPGCNCDQPLGVTAELAATLPETRTRLTII
jgi:hypothetical protein